MFKGKIVHGQHLSGMRFIQEAMKVTKDVGQNKTSHQLMFTSEACFPIDCLFF